MKTTITRLLYIAFILIIVISCEKEVDNVKYPEFKQKLVISGFISPDNPKNYIWVSSNIRIYGDKSSIDTIGKLSVTLSNNTRVISLDTSQLGFVCNSSDFPVEEGKTYTLKVHSDNGFYAEASCTVPFKRNFALEIDTFRIMNYNPYNVEDSYFNSDIYFTDILGEENYYMFFCEQINYDSQHYGSPFVFNIIGPENPYFNDKGIDGIRSRIALQVIGVPGTVDSSFLKVYLLNTDKAYYDYQKSLGNYNSGEDPFTEPSPVYSNITGGLGIFAAYTVDSLIFRLK
jgi:hypothetical protein